VLSEKSSPHLGHKAIYAAGVRFPPVVLQGKTFFPSQANNFYVFPAVGLAVYATKAKRVTSEMLIEAARATADQVTDEQREKGMLFPPQSNVLETEARRRPPRPCAARPTRPSGGR
jgi:malate dehydrogenase (oxaloacetate-decarboxylating)(NADP+)